MLDRPQEYEQMAGVERTLWWYRSLHELVLEAIRNNYASNEITILDAGCGTGGLLLYLKDCDYRNIHGFDLSEHAVAACCARGLLVKKHALNDLAQLYTKNSLDVIVSNDTLCYLAQGEQRTFVTNCHNLLKPGGILIMNLPALSAFGGIHDISVGLRQRFTLPGVRELFQKTGFSLRREIYWPFLASPPIFGTRLWQRIQMRLNKKFEVRSDVSLPPAWLNKLLYNLTCCENRYLRRKPWGSSLFVVARCLTGTSNSTGCQ